MYIYITHVYPYKIQKLKITMCWETNFLWDLIMFLFSVLKKKHKLSSPGKNTGSTWKRRFNKSSQPLEQVWAIASGGQVSHPSRWDWRCALLLAGRGLSLNACPTAAGLLLSCCCQRVKAPEQAGCCPDKSHPDTTGPLETTASTVPSGEKGFPNLFGLDGERQPGAAEVSKMRFILQSGHLPAQTSPARSLASKVLCMIHNSCFRVAYTHRTLHGTHFTCCRNKTTQMQWF